jgi:hypothetical protein
MGLLFGQSPSLRFAGRPAGVPAPRPLRSAHTLAGRPLVCLILGHSGQLPRPRSTMVVLPVHQGARHYELCHGSEVARRGVPDLAQSFRGGHRHRFVPLLPPTMSIWLHRYRRFVLHKQLALLLSLSADDRAHMEETCAPLPPDAPLSRQAACTSSPPDRQALHSARGNDEGGWCGGGGQRRGRARAHGPDGAHDGMTGGLAAFDCAHDERDTKAEDSSIFDERRSGFCEGVTSW